MANFSKRSIQILFFLSMCLVFIVSKSFAQQTQKRFAVNLQGASVDDLVQQLEKGSNYHFYYDKTQFDSLRITIHVADKAIDDVLNEAFNGSKFKYAIDDQQNVFLTVKFKINTDLRVAIQLPGNKPGADSAVASGIVNLDHDPKVVTTQADVLTENKLVEIGAKAQATKPGLVSISGYVRDVQTQEPLPGVYVFDENTRTGATTNEFGYYTISLARGSHVLVIKTLGQKETRRRLALYADGKLNIELKSQVVSLKEVLISQKSANLERAQMGVEKINIQTIKQVPTVFGEADIFKVILTLPGVKTVGEASGGFNVRGGATDQNLILFNDATIYNPSHFFGFFSAFNTEVVKDVELYKSSIPVKYGGRLSSVLEIDGRDGNKNKFTGSAGIGLLTSRLNIEGPLLNDKTSFILGGRTTYSNFIFGLLPDNATYKKSKASFYDVNLLIHHKISDKSNLYFTGYLSNDQSDLGTDTTYKYQNRNVSVKFQHVFNPKLTSTFVTGYDGYKYNSYSTQQPITAYNLGFDINQFNFKPDFTYYLNSKHTLNFGVSSIYYKLHPGSFTPLGSTSLVRPVVLQAEQALENAIYLGDNYDVNEVLSLSFGLRYSMFANLGPQKVYTYAPGLAKEENNQIDSTFYKAGQVTKTYSTPEIRFSARFTLNSTTSLKAGYNSLSQYIHLLTNTTAISPTDIWKLSDPNIKPQHGDQISLGLYKNLVENTIETSVEVYYKRIADYLDYKSGAQLLLNPHIETDVINTKGKAYGAEFFLKKATGKLNGWVSYTYSRTFLKIDDPTATQIINEGNYYPAGFDKPHDFTLVGNYKFTRRISFSLNLTYSTGRPITIPIGTFYYAGSLRALYGDRNSYRVPDYFRSDVSFNFEGNHKIDQRTHNSWTIGVYNLTGRKNAYSTFFTSQGGRINGYKLSIFGTAVPFINYNIRF